LYDQHGRPYVSKKQKKKHIVGVLYWLIEQHIFR